jgi:hypothetical protein
MDPGLARYAIRINGHLGATLLSAFLPLASRQQGAHTVLTGLLDRSALFGVLAEIEARGDHRNPAMTDHLPAGEPVGAMEGTRLPGDSRRRGRSS